MASKHVARTHPNGAEPGRSYCGQKLLWHHWFFQNADHGRRCADGKMMMVPCRRCMRVIEKEENDE